MKAEENGHLPVVEYLVEKGADMEAARRNVTDIVIDTKCHVQNISVNTLGL